MPIFIIELQDGEEIVVQSPCLRGKSLEYFDPETDERKFIEASRVNEIREAKPREEEPC